MELEVPLHTCLEYHKFTIPHICIVHAIKKAQKNAEYLARTQKLVHSPVPIHRLRWKSASRKVATRWHLGISSIFSVGPQWWSRGQFCLHFSLTTVINFLVSFAGQLDEKLKAFSIEPALPIILKWVAQWRRHRVDVLEWQLRNKW